MSIFPPQVGCFMGWLSGWDNSFLPCLTVAVRGSGDGGLIFCFRAWLFTLSSPLSIRFIFHPIFIFINELFVCIIFFLGLTIVLCCPPIDFHTTLKKLKT
jgi:hypothetical protein